ncbi:MAG: riboflavin synthase [Terrisporobacter sp.]|uniref:riboflavin synthase n=1 Tax=Terrisporobacter sp. TaxID=1965305 RepID=UPI0025D5C0C2|nr:riboflavin synthase [uncultured Terrisporobacter sp.]
MFTGIIEEIGIIQKIIKGEKSSVISIKASKILEETILGDSICVNGVCLTVTKMTKDTFEADVMAETLRKSNIGKLSIGSKVNLERALKLEGRFGGHIVSGHIDGVGEIISLIKEDNAIWVTVKTSKDILKYIVMKGSIAIDGISLTVAYIDNEVFKVSIIPHTGGETTLLHKKNGETVNLECDVIGKYIEKFMRLKEESGQIKKQLLDETFLRENGFI